MPETKDTALAVVGASLMLAGLVVSFLNQAAFEIPDDLDEEYTLKGTTSYVNTDYFFPYEWAFNTTYNGTGVSPLNQTHTTQRDISVKAVAAEEDFVTFAYNTTVVSQPTWLIDVNTGAAEGGVAEVAFNETPPMAYPFEPYRSHLTRMYLDTNDWSYREDQYEDNHSGYARSVMTHHLEKEDHDLYVGNLGEPVAATYQGTQKIHDLEGYAYKLDYTWQLPFPIYTNTTTNTTVFLQLQEISVEFHEPMLGVLLAQSDTVHYRLLVMGHGPPQEVLIYTEESDYEISADDADKVAAGLRMAKFFDMLPVILGPVGVLLLVLAAYKGGLLSTLAQGEGPVIGTEPSRLGLGIEGTKPDEDQGALEPDKASIETDETGEAKGTEKVESPEDKAGKDE